MTYCLKVYNHKFDQTQNAMKWFISRSTQSAKWTDYVRELNFTLEDFGTSPLWYFGTIHHFNAAGNILYKIKLNFISFVDFKDSDQIFSGCHNSEVKVPIAQLWNHDAFLNYQYFKSKKCKLIVMKYVVILSCAKLMTQYPYEKAVKIMDRKI